MITGESTTVVFCYLDDHVTLRARSPQLVVTNPVARATTVVPPLQRTLSQIIDPIEIKVLSKLKAVCIIILLVFILPGTVHWSTCYFMLWPHSEKKLHSFIRDFNNLHPTIKFTYEKTPNRISQMLWALLLCRGCLHRLGFL